MKKTVYLLIEKSFEQPTFIGFMQGCRGGERIVDKTTSLKKAKKWSEKSGLNTYREI